MISSNKSKSNSSARRAMRYLLPGIKQRWRRVACAMMFLAFSVAFRILEPWPIQFVVDSIVGVNKTSLFEQSPSNHELNVSGLALAIAALAFVLIALFRAVSDYFRTILFSLTGNEIVSDIRGRVYRHVQNLGLRFHQTSRGGDLTVRLVGDLNLLKDVAVSAALPLLSSALVLVGMLVTMIWINWRLGCLVLIVLPVFWFTAIRSSRRIHQSAKVQRQREGALAATAAESLSAVKSVQALAIGDRFTSSFAAQNKKSYKDGVKTGRLTARLERSVDVLIAIATATVLFFGAQLVLKGELTPGKLIVFLTYLKRGFKPLQDFAKYTGRLSKGLAASDRIIELLETEPEIVESKSAVKAPAIQGALEFSDVSFSYPDRAPVLHESSFRIAQGTHVAIVGPSGAGKSTLLSLLLRLHDPDSGVVKVDGHDIRNWTLRSLREQLSVVLQDNIVFAGTIRENIAMASPDATIEQIIEAARVAQAHDFITALPDDYDTLVGERGVNLSQGQRQRLAIARAALRQAPILLLDEPTSSLDSLNRDLVAKALKEVSKNKTTLLVTHDLELAKQSDLILSIDGKGAVVIETPLQVFGDKSQDGCELPHGSSELNPFTNREIFDGIQLRK